MIALSLPKLIIVIVVVVAGFLYYQQRVLLSHFKTLNTIVQRYITSGARLVTPPLPQGQQGPHTPQGPRALGVHIPAPCSQAPRQVSDDDSAALSEITQQSCDVDELFCESSVDKRYTESK